MNHPADMTGEVVGAAHPEITGTGQLNRSKVAHLRTNSIVVVEVGQAVETDIESAEVGHAVETDIESVEVGQAVETDIENIKVGQAVETDIENTEVGHPVQTDIENIEVGQAVETGIKSVEVGQLTKIKVAELGLIAGIAVGHLIAVAATVLVVVLREVGHPALKEATLT